jgi:hypothetical protein
MLDREFGRSFRPPALPDGRKQGLQREIGRHARLGGRLVSLTKPVLTVANVEVEEADETPDP